MDANDRKGPGTGHNARPVTGLRDWLDRLAETGRLAVARPGMSLRFHDPAQVEWAVATRFQADRDLVVVAEAQGSRLDPSARNGVGAKMGLDATKPLGAPAMRYTRIRVPGEDEVDVAAALAPMAATSWRAAADGQG